MRIFRPEVQAVLRMLTVATLLAMIVLPMAWGYEQRRRARSWHELACAYRVRELVRHAPLLADVRHAPDACATLRRLGFDLELER